MNMMSTCCFKQTCFSHKITYVRFSSKVAFSCFLRETCSFPSRATEEVAEFSEEDMESIVKPTDFVGVARVFVVSSKLPTLVAVAGWREEWDCVSQARLD